jgi:hypothetical protein
MATITAALVKELRESTGAGMMDCKAALTAVEGDFEAAVDWLRKKGLSKAAKKVWSLLLSPTTRASSSRSTLRPTSSRATRTSRRW